MTKRDSNTPQIHHRAWCAEHVAETDSCKGAAVKIGGPFELVLRPVQDSDVDYVQFVVEGRRVAMSLSARDATALGEALVALVKQTSP